MGSKLSKRSAIRGSPGGASDRAGALYDLAIGLHMGSGTMTFDEAEAIVRQTVHVDLYDTGISAIGTSSTTIMSAEEAGR